ncbi:MAG: hypothetical protein A3F09_05600 [Chlamydiae bacterium RIFCSPHIGHO2_12_FULL_49_11]|nr:MAG: hypothetical protein A3F09_05600 [Chlamydiae bacterium RIFCSPHIGHO2_12_FULL_49_11]
MNMPINDPITPGAQKTTIDNLDVANYLDYERARTELEGLSGYFGVSLSATNLSFDAKQSSPSQIELLFSLFRLTPLWSLLSPPPSSLASTSVFASTFSTAFPSTELIETLIGRIEGILAGDKIEQQASREEGERLLHCLQLILNYHKIFLDTISERSRYSKG